MSDQRYHRRTRELSAGTRFGHYEVQRAIGAGGMGEVYRARDTELDRLVALKVLPDVLSIIQSASRASSAKPGRWRR